MTKADRPNTGREDTAPVDWTLVAAPRGDLPAALAGTERPEHILRALRDLEQAMAVHDQWLTDWHAHLLSRFDPGNRQEGPPPPYPEATWFQNSHCASFLKDNPTFRTVGPALASIRRRADRLVAAVDRTGTVSVAKLMSAVTEFSKVVRHLHNDAWNRLANIDPLTGLGNRPAMLRRLTIECERRARNLQPCCVAVLDLDFSTTSTTLTVTAPATRC